MSAHLDLVRSIYAANERGEFFRQAPAWAHPEIEWIIADGPTAGSWTGVAGMAESFRNMLGARDDLRLYAEEFRELDDERVLVLHHFVGRGKTSGLDLGKLHTRGASVCQIRDGRLTKIVNYYDRDRAFADLGLEA